MPITRRQSVRTMVEGTAPPTTPAAPASPPVPAREPEAAPQEQQTATRAPQASHLPQPTADLPEQPARSLSSTTKPTHPKRSKLGWQIRDDLIKHCKQIALDEGIHDYEALETLLEEALAQRKARSI